MKRLTIYNLLLLHVILIIFTACVSVRRIEIKVAETPQLPISDQIQSLLLLNGSLTADFQDYNRDSLEAMLVRNELVMEMDSLFLDSVAADTALQSAGKYMFESGRFDIVIPVKRNINHAGLLKGQKLRLTKDDVDQLCREFETDAILILNDFNEKINTGFHVYYEVGDQGLMNALQIYEGKYKVGYSTEWFLLKAGAEGDQQRYVVNDTVYWESSRYSIQEMYDNLPALKEVLIGGGIAAGESMAQLICPNWKSDSRFYFATGNKEADTAIPLIKEDRWEEAASIWKKYSNSNSKNFRSKIEFNLALAAEMTGDLTSALEWGKKSFQSQYRKETDFYLRTLNKRVKSLNEEKSK